MEAARRNEISDSTHAIGVTQDGHIIADIIATREVCMELEKILSSSPEPLSSVQYYVEVGTLHQNRQRRRHNNKKWHESRYKRERKGEKKYF